MSSEKWPGALHFEKQVRLNNFQYLIMCLCANRRSSELGKMTDRYLFIPVDWIKAGLLGRLGTVFG